MSFAVKDSLEKQSSHLLFSAYIDPEMMPSAQKYPGLVVQLFTKLVGGWG